MVAHNTGSIVTCSVIKLAYYNLKLYELEIGDLIVAKIEFKIYRYRYRYRGKSLFTYRLLTGLKIPLPYISDILLTLRNQNSIEHCEDLGCLGVPKHNTWGG